MIVHVNQKCRDEKTDVEGTAETLRTLREAPSQLSFSCVSIRMSCFNDPSAVPFLLSLESPRQTSAQSVCVAAAAPINEMDCPRSRNVPSRVNEPRRKYGANKGARRHTLLRPA